MPDYRLGIRVETRDEASRGLDQINRKFDDLGDAVEDASRRGADAMSDLEREAQRLGRTNALDTVEREFENVGRSAEEMADDGREAFRQLERAGDGVDFRDVRDEIDRTGDALDDLREGFSGAFDLGSLIGAGAIGGAIGGAVSGLVGSVGGAIAAIPEAAANIEEATARTRTQLGLTREEAEAFRGVAEDLFRDVFGESVEENIQTLATIETIFRRIGGTENQEQLRRVAEHAIGIADAFDVDVSESVNAAVTLMDQFGLTVDEAFGFLVAGFQRGLNSSDDFLDTIGEYSGQFSDMGADAGEFFSILETGFEGGVLGTDKVADAFKEFNIRIQDDSQATRDALDGIGISYDELTAGFADGSVTQIDAAQRVIEKIREIDDPIQQNIIGVALFGTQWEDLTGDVILEVDSQKTKIGELESSVDDLGEQYDTTTTQVEEAFRKWELALIPFGQRWNELRANIASGVATILEQLNTASERIREVNERAAGMNVPRGSHGQVSEWFLPDEPAAPPLPGAAPLPRVPIEPRLPVSPAPPGLTPPVGGLGDRPLTQEELLEAIPVTAPPAGWVGAWPPGMASGGGNNGNVVVNQNFYGATEPRQVEEATLTAARRMGLR